MTELLDVPGGGILIEGDMHVVPRCGSCLEPLFSRERWDSVCRGADHMVGSGTQRDEALQAVIDLMLYTQERHVDLCLQGVSHLIAEEP